MNRFLLVSALFVVVGCATPGPEPDKSESFKATESSSNELPAQTEPADDFEDAEIVAGNFESSEGIQDVAAPEVEKSPAAIVQKPQMVESEIVCEKIIPTGSVMPVKVCRRQADIDRNRETDQKVMEDIKDSSAYGISRL